MLIIFAPACNAQIIDPYDLDKHNTNEQQAKQPKDDMF
jgi:hypothetical protein